MPAAVAAYTEAMWKGRRLGMPRSPPERLALPSTPWLIPPYRPRAQPAPADGSRGFSPWDRAAPANRLAGLRWLDPIERHLQPLRKARDQATMRPSSGSLQGSHQEKETHTDAATQLRRNSS